MKNLTKNELIDLLSKVKGTTFVSIETTTVPKLKSGNPFSNLKKVSKVSGAIGFNYQNSVNNALAKEDKESDFESKPRKWGEKIAGTPLVKHKDKFYLEMKAQNGQSDYFNDQGRVSKEDIKPWEYAKSSRQGLENEVIIRDFSIDNISRVKINKEEYNII